MVPILLEAGLRRIHGIVYSSFLNVVMLKYSVCASKEDRRVKKESMLGLELSLMKYYTYKALYQADERVKKESDIGAGG